MTREAPSTNGGPYRVARTVGGLFLIGMAGVVYLIRPEGDTGQMLLMLGTGGVLLGVDVVRRFVQ